ncbi:hypothetical protein ACP4OV_015856 [Aristida adscensionis]
METRGAFVPGAAAEQFTGWCLFGWPDAGIIKDVPASFQEEHEERKSKKNSGGSRNKATRRTTCQLLCHALTDCMELSVDINTPLS